MQGCPPLTAGSLKQVPQLAGGADSKVEVSGTYQLIEVRQVNKVAADAKPRYRARISDGNYWLSVMLSSQVQEMITNQTLKTGGFMNINSFITSEVSNRKMFIAMECLPLTNYAPVEPPIVYQPFTELVDAQKEVEEAAARGGPGPQLGQQQAGYGAPQEGGMYGAPPPAQNGGMYGAPPPAANSGPPPGGMYGAPPPGHGNGAPPGGMYGGPPPQANGGPQGGMYGAPPAGAGAPYGGGPGQYGGPPPPQGGPGANGGQYGGPPAGPGGYNNGAPAGGYNARPAGAQYGGAPGARPQPNYGGHGPIARDEAPPRIMPISALNPYTARWAIRGRITSKGELRRFSNVKGEGKVFSFDMLDREGGEIRATAFGAEADKFFEMIELGGVYQLSKASLSQKRPQYNHTNHNYEIKLDRNSVLERLPEDPDTAAIPAVAYNFRRITELETAEAGSMVDVVGVVESCDNWQTITRKTGEETTKRSMVLRDDSGRSIEVTLWGAAVNNPGDQIHQMVTSGARPILAAKGLRVADYNGKTLSTVGSSVVRLDPMDLPQAQNLRGWYDNVGRNQAANALSGQGGGAGGGRADRRTVFSAIKDENLGRSGKADWITVSAVLDMIKTDNDRGGRGGDAGGSNQSFIAYPGCPGEFNGRPCQKKMMDIGGGQYNCERCGYNTDQPAWRYMVQMSAMDFTAKQYLTAFGDAGDVIFGRTATELRQLEMDDPQEFERLVEGIRFTPMVFRLKVMEDTYNDETRQKVSIYRVEKLTNFVREGQLMLDYIRAQEAGQPVLRPFLGAEGQAERSGGGAAGGGGAYGGGGGAYGGGGGYGAGPGTSGAGGYNGPQQQQQQQHGAMGGGYGGGPQGTAPYGTMPQTMPQTNPYGAGGGGGGRSPVPPMGGPGGGPYGGGGGGGGGYGGPPQQQGGGGMYGAPTQQQQGGYGGPGGAPPGQGGGWNNGPGGPPPQQQGGWNGGGGGYGAPPQQQQQQGGYNNGAPQQPPASFW